MKHTFFAFVNRMKLINRWGLMRNQRTEDVAQHSHLTAVVAHALGLIDKEIFGLPTDPDKAAVFALYHETAEVLTGDMPTPVKYRDSQMTNAYKAAEYSAQEKLLNLLPPALTPAIRSAVSPAPSREARLVKLADKIAGFVKCNEEVSQGNQEFVPALKSHEAAIQSFADPAADYFMKEFGASFSMSLDELMRE